MKNLTLRAKQIYTAVLKEMQEADEIEGVEGLDYLDLMEAIAQEARTRYNNCADNMDTIEQKKEALINYETEWAIENMDSKQFTYLWTHGFKGFNNYTDEEIEHEYQLTFFD